jgi:signal transduction histidine kinase
MIVLVIAACVAVYVQISAIAVSREKAVLHGIAEVYRGIIAEDPSEPFERPGIDQHVAIIAPDGAVRMNTLPRSLHDRLDEIAAPGPALRELTYGGETYFVYVEPIETSSGDWTVLVTRDSDIATGIVSRVVVLLWILVLGSAVLFAVGAWAIATAALRPVERLRLSAERLAAQPRDVALLPLGRAGDEIDSLARTLNGLIERMRASGAREQQMIADASHELRNPLTVLRAQLELVDGTDPDADRTLLDDARATLNRLIRVAQSMLELSRIEAGGPGEETTLRDLVDELTERIDQVRWRSAEPSSGVRGDVELSIGPFAKDATARLSVADFARVVDNLLDNALHAAHGPARIRVTFRIQDGEAQLLVSDDGPGFDARIAERAFERFVRGDGAAHPGGGLGLAIVARIAERAGGSAAIVPSTASGAEVLVRVPIARAPDPGSANTHQR